MFCAGEKRIANSGSQPGYDQHSHPLEGGKVLDMWRYVPKKSRINQHYQYVPQDLNNPNTRHVPMLDGKSSTSKGSKAHAHNAKLHQLLDLKNASEARVFPPTKISCELVWAYKQKRWHTGVASRSLEIAPDHVKRSSQAVIIYSPFHKNCHAFNMFFGNTLILFDRNDQFQMPFC